MAEASVTEALDEDLEIERLARERRLARGLRVAARRAVALARRYRDEEGPRGQREAACVTQALAWRASARDVLSGKDRTKRVGPEIVRATPNAAANEDGRRAG